MYKDEANRWVPLVTLCSEAIATRAGNRALVRGNTISELCRILAWGLN